MLRLFKVIRFSVLALLAMTSCSKGSNANEGDVAGKHRLDTLFSNIEDSRRWMGSFSLYEGDTEVYSHSFGYADVNSKISNSTTTKFRIGSITSIFTATIVMKLAEQGRIDINQSINSVFPEINKSPKITIANLLHHRSGIFNLMLDLNYWTYYRNPITKDNLYKKIVDNGLINEPGTKTQYSSSNYILLAMLAENVSGKSYEELLDSIICKPLALENTYVGGSISPTDDEALSYLGKAPKWFEASETDLSTCFGESSIVSTPSDVNRFISALLEGKILNSQSVKKMKEYIDDYGIGFQQNGHSMEYDGATGSIDGFSTEVVSFIKDGKRLTFSYFSNASSEPLDIMGLAIEAYTNEAESKYLTKFSKVKELNREERKSIAGTFSNEKYATTFTISSNEETGELELTLNQGTDTYSIESFEGGEFRAELPEDENPILFKISDNNKSLILSNGMILSKQEN